jgi:von Willebrand factor type A domain
MKKWYLFVGLVMGFVLSGAVSCGPSGGVDDDGGTVDDGAVSVDVSDPGDGGQVWWDGGGGDGMVGCDPRNFVLQQAPPAEVYLVIDRSGSMSEASASPGLTKWEELNVALDTALTQFEAVIKFGVLTYPSNNECSTSGPQVGVALDHRQAVLDELTSAVPAGGTPTAAALNNAASSLSDLGSSESPKVVILATDGGPNCNYFLEASPSCTCTHATSEYCCTSHPSACMFGYTCLDDVHTVSTISDLQAAGIDTVVIGLAGTSEYEALLNAMALAGGQPQIGGATDYYPAGNQSEIISALQAVAVSFISCEIQLEEPPDFPDLVHVYMDGTEVEWDGSQSGGWDYTDPSNTVIELFGAACDTLQDGDEHNLTATFACVVN